MIRFLEKKLNIQLLEDNDNGEFSIHKKLIILETFDVYLRDDFNKHFQEWVTFTRTVHCLETKLTSILVSQHVF